MLTAWGPLHSLPRCPHEKIIIPLCFLYARRGGQSGWGSLYLDELELFNRSLTAPEFQTIYNAGSLGKCKPPCTISFTCATNKAVQCGSIWSFDAPTNIVDTCCTNYSVTFGTVTNSGACPLVATRTWLISDTCGHSNTCSQTVTVIDTTPPVITGSPAGGSLGCNSAPASMPTDASVKALVRATDNCGLSLTNVTHVDGGTACSSNRTFTITVTDACTNTASTNVVYTWIVDTTPPVFTNCPASTNLGCNPVSIPDCNVAVGDRKSTR